MVEQIEASVNGVLVSGFIEIDYEPHASIKTTGLGCSTGNTPEDLREVAQMLEDFADTIENDE